MSRHRTRGGHYIFVKWITRNGQRVYASQYGYKAFRIWVKDPKPPH